MKALDGAAAGGRQRGSGARASPGRRRARGEVQYVRAPYFRTIRRRSRPIKPQLLVSMGNPEIVGFYCHSSAMFILRRAILIN